MLSDSDPRKWDYPEHTRGKHAILLRYMKAWLPILHRSSRLAIVDAFAGRGRYATDAPGSPLILRDIASRVASDRQIAVDQFYIESDADNVASLAREIEAAGPLPGVHESGPIHDQFARVAPPIIAALERIPRPSFWFIDPFGYTGLPLALINRILGLPRSEVLITLMVRDINRFLDSPTHQKADAELFGLHDDELRAAIARVKTSPDRAVALRDLYVERLEATSGEQRRYVTSVGLTERGATDIVYFLVHTTGHPLGKREMKEAIWDATGDLNTVVGSRRRVESSGQLDLFGGSLGEALIDYRALEARLLGQFAGRRIDYERLLNETVINHTFDGVIDKHIKKALEDCGRQGKIEVYRNGTASRRALAKGDVLDFPAT